MPEYISAIKFADGIQNLSPLFMTIDMVFPLLIWKKPMILLEKAAQAVEEVVIMVNKFYLSVLKDRLMSLSVNLLLPPICLSV